MLTSEERLQRIEASVQYMAESHGPLMEALTDLTRMVGRYAESSDARMKRIEADLDLLALATTRFIDTADAFINTADARAKRIEESLEAFLRAMTAQRSNGGSAK
jgi:hypothetical protein